MVRGEDRPEKNEGSTADFAKGTVWRTASLHDESMGAMSPGTYIPCGAERLGGPATAEVIETVNSDEATTNSQA